ncbi:hypothetical protein ACOSQ3_025353 [Xanthoceras sorbifolium]
MKCCSLKRKDLNFHFRKMSHKYYILNDLNDETLRQVYINSLPDELQDEIHRHMASTRRDLRNTSLVPLRKNTVLSFPNSVTSSNSLASCFLKRKVLLLSPRLTFLVCMLHMAPFLPNPILHNSYSNFLIHTCLENKFNSSLAQLIMSVILSHMQPNTLSLFQIF